MRADLPEWADKAEQVVVVLQQVAMAPAQLVEFGEAVESVEVHPQPESQQPQPMSLLEMFG